MGISIADVLGALGQGLAAIIAADAWSQTKRYLAVTRRG
jgi:hypothetical protein